MSIRIAYVRVLPVCVCVCVWRQESTGKKMMKKKKSAGGRSEVEWRGEERQ